MTVARADRAGMRPRTCCPTHADACRFGRDHTWAGPYLLDAGRPVNGAVWSHAGDVLCSTCGGQCVADRVTGESVGRFEFDEAEGIAFWVSTSYEEAANMNRLSWYSEWIDHLECGSSTAEARHEGMGDE